MHDIAVTFRLKLTDRLVEDLVPFLDRDIHDPKASQLASHPKRKLHDSTVRPKIPSCFFTSS